MHPLLHNKAGLAILPLYFAATILIGWLTRRNGASANSYLNASRSLPLWIVTAAYVAANCGALEIVGLSAMAAQYGVQAFQFYWIGAIPAMVFLALWMMPVYRRSGVRSVPEYLEVRYGPSLRLMNAFVTAIVLLLLAGVSLYAMAQVLQAVAGLPFFGSVSLCAGVVLIYVLLGGIRATIYNEVFQLLIMVAGLLPLAIYALQQRAVVQTRLENQSLHLWTHTPLASNASPFDAVGVVFGLGFVLSFGYWCTDFVLMQRAFTARTEHEARQVPLWAGFGKLAFSLMVVLPGLAAATVIPALGRTTRFDQALPQLMLLSYGPVMLGLGITTLAASLMSGLAANVSAFAAIWTEDIYRARLRPQRSDGHYLKMGRVAVVVAVIASSLASFLNFLFGNLMENVQLIFSIFGAPFWAMFLLGMATRRTTERGAFTGFCAGAGVALAHLALSAFGWLHYGSVMSSNFHGAIYAFAASAAVGWGSSLLGAHPQPATAPIVFSWRMGVSGTDARLLWCLAGLLLATCAALNLIWR